MPSEGVSGLVRGCSGHVEALEGTRDQMTSLGVENWSHVCPVKRQGGRDQAHRIGSAISYEIRKCGSVAGLKRGP